jgi:hypothetical protein
MWFSDNEIKILIQHFGCKSWEDLGRAARRYESLFFMFDHETAGFELDPGEDFRLVLELAKHCIFENFTQTDQPLQPRYLEKPKRGPGRTRKEPLPEDLTQRFTEARKVVPNNEAAVVRLKSLGIIPEHARALKPKTILRYIQEDEKRKRQEAEEQHRRYLEAIEAYAPSPPEDLI